MGPLACAVSPGLAMQVGKCRGVWQRWATCGGRRHDVTSAQTAGVPSIKNSMVLGKCSMCVCVWGGLQGLVSGTRVVAVASYRYTHRGEEVERDSGD